MDGGETNSNQVHFVVPKGNKNVRSDKLLADHFKGFSRSNIQQAFKDGNVFLNKKAISKKHKISAGEEVYLTLPESKVTSVGPVPMNLEVLFEDEYIISINKEPGVVVHPGNSTAADTLVHGLLHHTKGNLCTEAGADRPGVVHRLDKETTGVIVFSKTLKAYLGLIKLFSEREMRKEYLALIQGEMYLDSGSIKEPIDRHPTVRVRMAVVPEGRTARTDWAVEKRLKNSTLVRCFLHTGRTHQIRVHLSHSGHPILGDKTYGYRPKQIEPAVPERVLLHSELLEFEHPVTKKKLTLHAPLPEDFQEQVKLRES